MDTLVIEISDDEEYGGILPVDMEPMEYYPTLIDSDAITISSDEEQSSFTSQEIKMMSKELLAHIELPRITNRPGPKSKTRRVLTDEEIIVQYKLSKQKHKADSSSSPSSTNNKRSRSEATSTMSDECNSYNVNTVSENEGSIIEINSDSDTDTEVFLKNLDANISDDEDNTIERIIDHNCLLNNADRERRNDSINHPGYMCEPMESNCNVTSSLEVPEQNTGETPILETIAQVVPNTDNTSTLEVPAQNTGDTPMLDISAQSLPYTDNTSTLKVPAQNTGDTPMLEIKGQEVSNTDNTSTLEVPAQNTGDTPMLGISAQSLPYTDNTSTLEAPAQSLPYTDNTSMLEAPEKITGKTIAVEQDVEKPEKISTLETFENY